MLTPRGYVEKSNSVWTQQPFVPGRNGEIGVDFIKINRNSAEGLRNVKNKADISRPASSTYLQELKRGPVGPVAARKGRDSCAFFQALENRTGPVAIARRFESLQNRTCFIGKPAPSVDVRWKFCLEQKNYIA